jgi:hypothetical protein
MNRTFVFYRVMLIIVAVLAFALGDPQKSNASADGYKMDYPNDSPFSLPFDSDIADQTDNDDYQSYGEDYQTDNDIPFP